MRKFGLAAILTFVDKGATAAMGRVGRRAALLRKQFQGVGRGVAQMRAGLGQMATAAIPVAAGFGLMLKKGVDFQQAVADLRAVTLDTTGKSTRALKSLAKTLGATTVFSATQAATAMTDLARAGLTTKQIMGAVGGTLNAAAAEGVDLATAAKMVASNIKAFNLRAEEAAKIAGILALASARTNTNMVDLQEGLKLAAPAVKPLNVSLADTSALLGALADIGLRGTLGGTAVRASVAKLLKPTKDAKSALASLGISITAMRRRMDKGDLVGVFKSVVAQMQKIPSRSKRAELMSRIFGIRGQTMTAAMDLTDKAMKRFNVTLGLLRKETGKTARSMAEIKLDTIRGQATLLASAFEGVSIEIFGMVSGETRGLVNSFSKTLGDLALALRVVRGEKITDPKARKQLAGISQTTWEVARGIREAFGELKETFRGIFQAIGRVGRMFGLTGDGSARSIAKIVTKVTVLTAAFAPLALVLGGVTRLFGGMARTALGAVRTVTGALGGIFKVGRGLFGGKLGKAGKLLDVATAMPVRVVNFHEMGAAGMLGGLGGTSGAREIDLAARGASGALARFRGGLNRLAGKVPLIGNLLASNLDRASLAAGGLKGALGKAGLLGAALGAGYALGTLIDRATGASKKISDAAFNFTQKLKEKATAPLKTHLATMRETATAADTLRQLVELSRRGKAIQTTPGGPRQEITRELARTRLLATLQKQELNQAQIAQVLRNVAPLLAKLPAKGAGGAGVKPVKPAKDAFVSTSGLLPVSAGDVVLDRASLAGAVVSQLRGGLAGRAGAGALGGGDPGRTSPAPAQASGPLRIEVPVELNGRQIALAVAEIQLDELERGGASLAPGSRRAFFERGTVGGMP